MSFAIRIHQTGGPEVMRWEEVAVGDPAPGEARVRHEAVGLNFLEFHAVPEDLDLVVHPAQMVKCAGRVLVSRAESGPARCIGGSARSARGA